LVKLGGDHFFEFGGECAPAGLGFVAMHNAAEGIHPFRVDQHVEFDKVAGHVAGVFVVHGSIPPGDGFHFVHKIDEDFIERKGRREHDPFGIERFGVGDFSALFHDELHEWRDILVGNHDKTFHDGLADFANDTEVGELFRVVDAEDFSIGAENLVDDRWVGGDDVHIELPAEAFEDNFHVKESEKTTSESKPKGHAGFRHELESRVIELESAHGQFQSLKVGGIDGINSAEDHGLDFLEAGKWLGCGNSGTGEGVSDFDLSGGFDIGNDVADVPGDEFVFGEKFGELGAEDADFLDFIGTICRHELHGIACFDRSLHDAGVDYDAPVGVEGGVKCQGSKGGRRFSSGCRNTCDNGLQDFFNSDSCFCAGVDGLIRRDGKNVFQLFIDGGNIGIGEIDLVDDGNEFEALFFCEVDVGDGLGFDTLGGIHNEEGSLAGGQGAGDFVGEINVTGSV